MKFAHFEFDPQTDRLGEGPLSEVYRAVDTDLGRTVALKILRAHAEIDPAADQRFQREARNTSKLDHPNIATVYEYGKDQGTSFIAMEYLAGQPLDRVLKEETLGYEECQRIGLQVCGALAHVHENGLIHRDLKPGNIMVLHDGTVKLLDFGIARASNESSITQVGMLVGTVLYMAPEQVRGDELDFRSDVFALGSVLYHMMTGSLPFPGKSFPEVCMAILDGNARRPSLVRSGFPAPLEAFITRCLETDPEKRFPDAEEAYGALLSASESIARKSGTRGGNIAGTLLVPPFRSEAVSDDLQGIAAGVRKDLAGELARIQGLAVDLIEEQRPTDRRPFDFLLRGDLTLDHSRGRLALTLERYDKNGGTPRLSDRREEVVEQEEENEWALQETLVRTAARAVRRRLTEYSITPAGEAGRDSARALETAARAHEKLMRGTTKHLMGSVSMFRRAIEQDPYCPTAYAGLAEAMVRKYLYWDGDASYLAEARDYCEQALALNPECARAHTALGFAFHLSGHQTDAQREYRIAIQLDDEEWLAHRLLGAILRRNGNFKEAEPRLRRAIELRPMHIGSYDHLFNVLRRLDRHDEAREIADLGIGAGTACVEQEPDNQEARLGMAILYARIGDLATARRCLKAALENAPKDGYTNYLAGCVYAIMGDSKEAIEMLRKAHDRGFYVQSELRNNDDLDVLRGSPEFEELVR